MPRLSIDRQQINVFGSEPSLGLLVAVILFGFVLLAIGLGACANPAPLPAGTSSPSTTSSPVGTSAPAGTLPVDWPTVRTAVEAAGWDCEPPYEVVEPGEGEVECRSPNSYGTAVVSGAEHGRVDAVTITYEGPTPSEDLHLWATATGGAEAGEWLLNNWGETAEGDTGGVHLALSRPPPMLKVTPR